jgi:undecaprenyl-diphosphatase
MLEVIQKLDELIILAMNGSNSPFWDPVMWWVSGKTSWWPFYLGLIIFIFIKKKWISGGIILIFIILLIALSDQTSVHFFKEVFQRPRPSHNSSIEQMLNYVNNYRGGNYGFISSHASNSFAFAGFLSLIFRIRWLSILLIAWATLVSYSRIYLGVHYLSDILVGALWGLFLAFLVYRGYRMLRLNFNQANQQVSH